MKHSPLHNSFEEFVKENKLRTNIKKIGLDYAEPQTKKLFLIFCDAQNKKKTPETESEFSKVVTIFGKFEKPTTYVGYYCDE